MSEPETIDHATIREASLLERYDAGRLSPGEESAFEEHLLGCPACQEELELHRSFVRGVRTMAAEDAAIRAVPLAVIAWLARRSRALQGGVLAALALVVAGALALPLLRAPGAGGGVVETGTPVFLLDAHRSDGGAPAATIEASEADRPLILAIDVGADPRFTGYRLTVVGPDGEELFRASDLQPNALEVVMASFPPGFFAPGDHRMLLDGLLPGGRTERLAEHPFRVR